MRIGELSKRSGASQRSIRYYESVGLLASERNANGCREFDADALEQIAKIKLLLRVGLNITDIVAVLPCVDTPTAPRCAHAQRRLDEQIARIERQQRLLAEAKTLLQELRREGASTATPVPGEPIRAVNGSVTAGIR